MQISIIYISLEEKLLVKSKIIALTTLPRKTLTKLLEIQLTVRCRMEILTILTTIIIIKSLNKIPLAKLLQIFRLKPNKTKIKHSFQILNRIFNNIPSKNKISAKPTLKTINLVILFFNLIEKI